MKLRVLLLNFSCIVFAISTCAGQSAMIKEDLSHHGFSIVLPTDPSYGIEIDKLGFANGLISERLRPISVIVKNGAERAIIAFGIRWTKRHLISGTIATDDSIYIQRFGLLDGSQTRYGGSLEGVIQPGTSVLVTVAGMVQRVGEFDNANHSLPDISQWVFEKVQLDSVVFDDGKAFGRDDLKVAARLKAQVDAQQDLMEEISDRFHRGEHLRDVLQSIQGATLPAKQVPLSEFDASRDYGEVRQQYLVELMTTEKNFGEEIAVKRVDRLTYTFRPNIRLAIDGDENATLR